MSVLSAAIVLILIMDPIGNAPTFAAVLSHVPPTRRRRIILRELLIALGILLAFLLFGSHLLTAMNISPPALSIAGGVVLFLIALKMIFPRDDGSQGLGPKGEDPFIVPLAMPMLAGPSAIAMVVLFSTREPDRLLYWGIALLGAWAVTSAVLLASEWLLRLLKEKGQRALVRLMGMILTAMAIQMLLDGISEYWATLPARGG